MNPQRFHKIDPDARADDFDVVTSTSHAPGHPPWKVVLAGREVTSGSAEFCLLWIKRFREVIG
jgi:hypothetical protein